MIQKDAITELRIQNHRDAYVALFNALGPKHYATLKAAFDLGEVLMEEADDIEEALPYLQQSYEGLNGRDAEVRESPWKPGVYFALALMAVENTGRCLEVSENLLNKYENLAEDDLVSYLFLQEFRCSIYRSSLNMDKFCEIAIDTYRVLNEYLEQDEPKYLHWLMLTVLGLNITGKENAALELLEGERKENNIDGEPISDLADVTFDLIEAYAFQDDEDEMKDMLKEGFSRLLKTDEFSLFDEDEMREYFSALSPLFIPIQDEVGIEVEVDEEE